MAIGEAGISFYPAGGHNHDGQSSSLLDFSKYSVWDWEWDFITSATPLRAGRQLEHYQSFVQTIGEVVSQSVLTPAGLTLLPGSLLGSTIAAGTLAATSLHANSITADQISAGAITGDLLNANVVLVNQVIQSNNYSPNVSGWAIFGNGDAEFANTSIRGTLTAVELQIDENNFWEDDGFMLGGNTGIYTSNGNVRIGTNVIIEGTIIADQIAINNNNFWNDGGFALGGTAGIYTSDGVVRIGTSVIIEGDIVADSV